MAWMLTWLNVSVATLNATLQFLVIYRLRKKKQTISEKSKNNAQLLFFFLEKQRINQKKTA